MLLGPAGARGAGVRAALGARGSAEAVRTGCSGEVPATLIVIGMSTFSLDPLRIISGIG